MGFMDPGNVVWFEISTADGQAVKDFYGSLLGWSFAVDPDSSVNGVTYTRIMAPGMPFPMGAIYDNAHSPEETMNVSIVSADVAADQKKLESLGASVVVPATQVSDVTTFARLADPQGNVFSLFQNNQTPERLKEFAGQAGEQMQEMAAKPGPGSYAWFEIGTTNPAATQDFYSQAFGWRLVFDDSAGGKQYYNVFTGNQWPSGGMYDLGADGIDYLMPDFLVPDVPAVTAKAQELGATVEFGPDANPDGLVYSRIVDPRGNRFGLFSMPTAA
ncbi:hydroxylase [Streptomyces sp. ERV7]|uniref:VOC family protein n=1 Tax=Streptomyces sp. ERV7 TaxID=1322334 RepID=UPI0007F552E8|nr:VOC family protein [Streptomyces sp. ERV7]OAR22026.1 hydroxylase [Streptomyces sp. ERV7]